MKTTGIIITLLGLGLTVYTAISYFSREKILKIGTIELTNSQPQYYSWLPFIGIAIMVIGAFESS